MIFPICAFMFSKFHRMDMYKISNKINCQKIWMSEANKWTMVSWPAATLPLGSKTRFWVLGRLPGRGEKRLGRNRAEHLQICGAECVCVRVHVFPRKKMAKRRKEVSLRAIVILHYFFFPVLRILFHKFADLLLNTCHDAFVGGGGSMKCWKLSVILGAFQKSSKPTLANTHPSESNTGSHCKNQNYLSFNCETYPLEYQKGPCPLKSIN